MSICSTCGAEADSAASFCSNCGEAVFEWHGPSAAADHLRPLDVGNGGDLRQQPQALHECPLCRSEVAQFLPFKGEATARERPNAKCPSCGSLERHRLMWLYFGNETNLFDGAGTKRMLHVAPEPTLMQRLRARDDIDYVAADLNPTMAGMVRMDITAIEYPDEAFDVIYCSHVLEHVPDDRKAMREFRRVLRPSGWAILQVPVIREHTDEDLSVVDPEERSRRFGQFDHVRAYGLDYKDRLAEAGFSVRVDRYAARLGAEFTRRFGLQATEAVYYCIR